MKIKLNIRSIKLILGRRNKDYNWISERTGLSISHIYKLMQHRVNPSPDCRARIQHCFNNEAWDRLFIIEEE